MACEYGLGTGHRADASGAPIIGAGAAIGCVGYGLSLVLFVLALRHLGAARAGAYFSVAPFFGAALALVVQGDASTWQLAR